MGSGSFNPSDKPIFCGVIRALKRSLKSDPFADSNIQSRLKPLPQKLSKSVGAKTPPTKALEGFTHETKTQRQ